MINLGPYSGKNCPNVRFQPTVIDRILEGTALLIVLVTWISIYWLYTQREGALLPAVWVMGGCSIFCRSEERRVGKECRSRWSPYH